MTLPVGSEFYQFEGQDFTSLDSGQRPRTQQRAKAEDSTAGKGRTGQSGKNTMILKENIKNFVLGKLKW